MSVVSASEIQGKGTLALSRSYLYGMLARIYVREVDLSLLEALRQPHLTEVWRTVGFKTGRELLAGTSVELLEELAVEYARLFLGPGPHVSPYESVHADRSSFDENGMLMGETAVKIKETLDAWGFQFVPTYNDLPDHLAVELQLMQHLCLSEAACWSRQDEREALVWRLRQEYLLEEHLRRWVPRFCHQVLETGPHPLYKATTLFVLELITADVLDHGERATKCLC